MADLEPTRLFVRDLIAEAVAGMLQRPGRSVLTMLGTVLGIGAFVSILGMTATVGGQIDKRFTMLAATEVMVEDVGAQGPDAQMSFPADATDRIAQIDGVVGGGVFWPIPSRSAVLTGTPGLHDEGSGATVYAAHPGALSAMHPTVRTGRVFDMFHESRAERVAVLGSAIARRLGISHLDANPAVFINGTPYTVIGIIDNLQRQPELLFGAVIPERTALRAFGPPRDQPAKMLIETRLGAAKVVADQVGVALRPDDPSAFKAIAPLDPQSLRGGVTADLNGLFLLLASISMIVGAVGIANTTLVAVLERTAEIGLRRALGARKVHIGLSFLAESAALGTMGGLLGTSVGVGVVVAVSLTKHWTAILQPWAVLPAPLVGTVVGLVAGLYPALRAARIEPADSLRR